MILLNLKMTEQRTIIKMKTIATLIKTTGLIKVTIHLLSRMITKTAIMSAIMAAIMAAITAVTIAATTVITEAQQLLQQTTVEVTQEVKHHKPLLHHRRRQLLLHRSKSQQLKINVAVKSPYTCRGFISCEE